MTQSAMAGRKRGSTWRDRVRRWLGIASTTAGTAVVLSIAYGQWSSDDLVATDEGAQPIEATEPRLLTELEADQLSAARLAALRARVEAPRDAAPGEATRVYGVPELAPAAAAELPPPPDAVDGEITREMTEPRP